MSAGATIRRCSTRAPGSARGIFERAQGLGGGFASLRLQPGERVVVTMANCPEVSIVYQALWRAGLVVTAATLLAPALEYRRRRRGRGLRVTSRRGGDRGRAADRWARDRIGGDKYPREVDFVDAIPLTPEGKIDRKTLRRCHDA